MSYTFKNDNGYQDTEVVCHEETLPEIMESFENFLRGCGFKIDYEEKNTMDMVDAKLDELKRIKEDLAAHIPMLQQLAINTGEEFPSDQDYKNLVHNMREVLKNARRIGMDK